MHFSFDTLSIWHRKLCYLWANRIQKIGRPTPDPIQSNPNAIRAHFFNLVVQLWCCCFFLSFRQFIECAFTFTDLCSPNKIDMNLFGSLIFISSHSTFGHTRLNWTVHTAHCTSNTKNTLDLKQEMKNPNIKRCTPCAFSFSMLQH